MLRPSRALLIALGLVPVLLTGSTAEALTLPNPSARGSVEQESAHGRELVRHTYHGTGTGYGRRNQNSWVGFLFGFFLLGIAPFFLVMTEVQGVKVGRLILRARACTLSNVPSSAVDPNLEGKLIHTVGPISVKDFGTAFTDKETGVSFGADAHASALVNAGQVAFRLHGSAAGAGQPMVASTPLRIERVVEMWQWAEEEHDEGGVTEYNYETRWCEVDLDSSTFKVSGHDNPRRRIVDIHSKGIDRAEPCLGAFSLPKQAVAKADWYVDAAVHPSTTLAPELTAKEARVLPNGEVFIRSGAPPYPGAPPGEPSVGDMRIKYRVVEIPADSSTVIGVQEANGLRAFTNADAARAVGKTAAADSIHGIFNEDDKAEIEALSLQEQPGCCQTVALLSKMFTKLLLVVMKHVVGTEVLLLSPLAKGTHSMFFSEELRVEKALSTFRLVGTILFIAAFYLILNPIAVLFSFIPFLGSLIKTMLMLAAFIVGLSCSLITIASAWLVVKPLRACIGFILLGGLYMLEVHFDGASPVPVFVLGGLAALAAVLAAVEAYNDCQFMEKAQQNLAAASYVQVAMPVGGEKGGAATAVKGKAVEMV